jgi:hypothetical protein
MDFLKLLLAVAAAATLAGCEVIGTIFEIGMWVGIMIVLAIVALIGFVVAKLRR